MRQVKRQFFKTLDEGKSHTDLVADKMTPKIGYALLGASTYPDSVIQYLMGIRFKEEKSNAFVG